MPPPELLGKMNPWLPGGNEAGLKAELYAEGSRPEELSAFGSVYNAFWVPAAPKFEWSGKEELFLTWPRAAAA
jgi:hypothetical protein